MDDQTNREGTAPSSPSSSTQQSGLKAAKDRKCPFCAQAFTSSSLGRHLDLYIKPRNPKPADGIHDVDEILKLRGGITRRQPKTGAKAESAGRDSMGPSHVQAGNDTIGRVIEERERFVHESPIASPSRVRDLDSFRPTVNASNWHLSGVIGDLPPRGPPRSSNATPTTGQAQRAQDMRRDATSGLRIQRPDHPSDNTWRLHEQAETGRAAEMALREVLSSVQAARRKLEPEPLYSDFDFFAQPFPGLVLAILPPPATLHSPAPFASEDSWALTAPGKREFEIVCRLLMVRTAELRRDHPDNPSDSAIFLHNSHVQGAYSNWRLMSDSDKSQAWTMQVLRAFSTSREQLLTTKSALDFAQQRIAHLEAEYDLLSKCQLPREALTRPPTTMPVPTPVARELSNSTTAASAAGYNADALLSKWRDVVRSTARPRQQSGSHNQTPTYVDSILGAAGRNRTEGEMIVNGAIVGVGGPMPRDGRTFFDDHDAAQRGVVLGAADEDATSGEADADAEEIDVSNVLDLSITSSVDRQALERQRKFASAGAVVETWQPPGGSVGFRTPVGSVSGEVGVNGNGKRGSEGLQSGRQGKVARMYG
nr:hypothetical protein B0A51_07089 [Rachicladosporium sp. CCFEE 5018]